MAFLVSCADGGEERIVGDTSYKFNNIEVGSNQLPEHTFTLKNNFQEKVKIVSSKTSCGCTTSSFPTEYISAGKQFQIVANLRTGNIQGPKSERIVLALNNGYLIDLRLYANVRLALLSKPQNPKFHIYKDQIKRMLCQVNSGHITHANTGKWNSRFFHMAKYSQ